MINNERKEKKMRTIETQCGIYQSKYTLTIHRDGEVSVKCPVIKWVNNSGSLSFETRRFSKAGVVALIKEAFEDQDRVRLHEILGNF